MAEMTVTLGNVEVTQGQLEDKLRELKEKKAATKFKLKVGMWFQSVYSDHNIHYVESQGRKTDRDIEFSTIMFNKDGVLKEKNGTWYDGYDDYVIINPFGVK